MIIIHLRQALDAYEARTGERLTHEDLAARTGLSRATLDSIASRRGYNASLRAVDAICRALRCSPGELLELTDDDMPEAT
ncbi:helix-turn-helix transcriptional regulator [Roseicyclus sp. F158]|uniref:Helix-turn-helix transcriptional regulator n=1 Tax=Tropicimonas omnivorans TaxID=3075590 RepID=A0ABU3DLN8_9RHOB|nr:helix-turn-helix transcriptional regulator [Roseicyclus sp. F158]MDT0684617.1 helix-turn-helix transcriptional regulator [Roseicyclus sp. F158]